MSNGKLVVTTPEVPGVALELDLSPGFPLRAKSRLVRVVRVY